MFEGWLKRSRLEIPGSVIQGSLTNYPVLLTEVSLPSDIFTYAQAAGGDLRFSLTADGSVELPREIVNFDGTNAEIYVLLPNLISGIDTYFYVFYGNSNVSDYADSHPYGKHAVWANYDAVYHFNQDPALGVLADSTANGNDGTVVGTNPIAGTVGGLTSWNFDDGYVDISNFSNQSFDNFSAIIYNKLENSGNSYAGLLSHTDGGSNGTTFFVHDVYQGYALMINNDNGWATDTYVDWQNVNPLLSVYGQDIDNQLVYVDNNIETRYTRSKTTQIGSQPKIFIGQDRSNTSRRIKGHIGHLRVCDNVISEELSETTHHNYTAPETFVIASDSVIYTPVNVIEIDVDTDGNGSYLDMQSAIDAYKVSHPDLVAINSKLRFNCSGIVDDTGFTFNTFNVDSERCIEVVGNNTTGVHDVNKYTVTGNIVLDIDNVYLKNFSILTNSAGTSVLFNSDNCYVINCPFIAQTPASNQYGVRHAVAGAVNYIVNCIFDGFTGGNSSAIRGGFNYIGYAYNCVFNNNLYHGFSTSHVSFKNCILQNAVTDDFLSNRTGSETEYLLSDNDVSSKTNSISNTTITFADPVNYDFRVTDKTQANIRAGVDLSADANFPFDYDATGAKRIKWDIGAFYLAPTLVEFTVDTGGTGNYISLQAAIDDQKTVRPDLVANFERLRFNWIASTGLADTAVLTIDTFNTDTDTDIQVIGDNDTGIYDVSKSRLDCNTYSMLIVSIDNVNFENCQFRNAQVGDFAAYSILFDGIVKSENCIYVNASTGANQHMIRNTHSESVFINNLFVNKTITGLGANTSAIFGDTFFGQGIVAYNNTFVDFPRGLVISVANNGSAEIRNNIAQGSTTAGFVYGTTTNCSNNISEDGTAPGSDSLNNTTVTFEDAANGNFKPTTYYAGTDLSYLFTEDITGTTIVDWMIGSFVVDKNLELFFSDSLSLAETINEKLRLTANIVENFGLSDIRLLNRRDLLSYNDGLTFSDNWLNNGVFTITNSDTLGINNSDIDLHLLSLATGEVCVTISYSIPTIEVTTKICK